MTRQEHGKYMKDCSCYVHAMKMLCFYLSPSVGKGITTGEQMGLILRMGFINFINKSKENVCESNIIPSSPAYVFLPEFLTS